MIITIGGYIVILPRLCPKRGKLILPIFIHENGNRLVFKWIFHKPCLYKIVYLNHRNRAVERDNIDVM